MGWMKGTQAQAVARGEMRGRRFASAGDNWKAFLRAGWRLRANIWFPHVPLAVLLLSGSVWLLACDLGPAWPRRLGAVFVGHTAAGATVLPDLLIGLGLLGGGQLLLRSRLA